MVQRPRASDRTSESVTAPTASGILRDRAVSVRLIDAVVAEQCDEWAEGHRLPSDGVSSRTRLTVVPEPQEVTPRQLPALSAEPSKITRQPRSLRSGACPRGLGYAVLSFRALVSDSGRDQRGGSCEPSSPSIASSVDELAAGWNSAGRARTRGVRWSDARVPQGHGVGLGSERHARAALGWLSGALAFLLVIVFGHGLFSRVELRLVAGAGAATVLLGGTLLSTVAGNYGARKSASA